MEVTIDEKVRLSSAARPPDPVPRRRRRLALAGALAGAAVAATVTATITVPPAAAISGGRTDVSSPGADAVVRLLGCTGTLITPTVVLTAGHCLSEEDRGTNAPHHPPAQVLGRCPHNWQVAGRWYRLTQGRNVSFGRDRRTPTATRRTTHYAMTPCADMVLLRLDRAVARRIAVPIPVLANLGDHRGTTDADLLKGESFTAHGWGLDASGSVPRLRQRADARYGSRTDEKLIPAMQAGASIQPGDSGSPLIWTSPSKIRYVVGVAQQSGTNPVYTPTFRGPVLDFPPVSALFSKAVPEALYCPTSQLRRAGTLPLGAWWGSQRQDNAIIADNSFAGCHSAIRSPGYRFFRLEGHVFAAARPRPPGTVPLYHWYSPLRGDNFVSTSHQRAGSAGAAIGDYRFVRIEGYVYHPGRTKPAGTRTLFTWYSPSRKDHYTTTMHAAVGARRGSLLPDYRFVRVEGFVPRL